MGKYIRQTLGWLSVLAIVTGLTLSTVSFVQPQLSNAQQETKTAEDRVLNLGERLTGAVPPTPEELRAEAASLEPEVGWGFNLPPPHYLKNGIGRIKVTSPDGNINETMTVGLSRP